MRTKEKKKLLGCAGLINRPAIVLELPLTLNY